MTGFKYNNMKERVPEELKKKKFKVNRGINRFFCRPWTTRNWCGGVIQNTGLRVHAHVRKC